MSEPVCTQCGMSLTNFNETGRLGCADCYTAFKNELIPVFKHVHGSDHHAGKIPLANPGQLEMRKELLALRRALKMAVAREEFEQAALLRDRIFEIEHKKEPVPVVQR